MHSLLSILHCPQDNFSIEIVSQFIDKLTFNGQLKEINHLIRWLNRTCLSQTGCKDWKLYPEELNMNTTKKLHVTFLCLQGFCHNLKNNQWWFVHHLHFNPFFKIYPYHPLRSQGKFSLLSARQFSWCSFGEFGIGSTNNFSLFSSLVCLMLYWYWEEKFYLGHMWELKADQNISNNCVSTSSISKRSTVTSISPLTTTGDQHRTSPKKSHYTFQPQIEKRNNPIKWRMFTWHNIKLQGNT